MPVATNDSVDRSKKRGIKKNKDPGDCVPRCPKQLLPLFGVVCDPVVVAVEGCDVQVPLFDVGHEGLPGVVVVVGGGGAVVAGTAGEGPGGGRGVILWGEKEEDFEIRMMLSARAFKAH